ncbi:Histidine transport system permease protein HisM [Hartmannibacter diazotrophicus]|uniref:Histidine transport system permease protein HisM n=1 Tax=Hartmannibacter diazotrophicus TaxID=1482074 RepID=A0A2C9D9N3_9HYPH|nr:ABC transporter permease [Hartmannibacter diazotrophicus]SON56451.1 Histidine transport system permease protein HisM [Hartmannibacter diazotrophicus]
MSTTDTLPPPVSTVRPWTGKRIAGHVFLGFWILLGLVIVYSVASGWDGEFIAKYGPRLWDGLQTTLWLCFWSLLIGALLSLPITLGRLSSNRIFSSLAFAWVYFFRGTPLLAQTFLVYYGAGSFREALEVVGLWSFFRDAVFCVIFTFALNTSAYQAEILSGAIRNVPKGQREAGASLSLPAWVTFFKVILPQALIVALRPYGNEIILMIKGSAIASIVTVLDLMGETRYAFSKSFNFEAYLWAAVLYLAMVEVIRRIWDMLEGRLTRHLKRKSED